MNKSVKKRTVYIRLKGGLEIDIKGMPEDKINEIREMIDSKSEERIYISGDGYFMPKEIAKMEIR